jgi:hypothetical protein
MVHRWSLRTAILTAIAFLAAVSPAIAAEKFRFPEGKHGNGELRYIDGLPVLTVAGTPEEIGEQVGTLALKPSWEVVKTFRKYLEATDSEKVYPLLVVAAKAMYAQFPEEYRRECDAMCKAAGVDRDLIILANTFLDIKQLGGCSGLLVSAERSTTGKPLYGRNLDFNPVGRITESELVIIYRPAGKLAFALVTFPGLLATGSGMNESGLALGSHLVAETGDGSAPFNPKGTASVIATRRVFEECRSVADVEKWLRAHPLASMANVAACDSRAQAVFEISTKTVAVRRPVDGLVAVTNHFRDKGLAVDLECRRFTALEKSRDLKQLAVADVHRHLHAANQGRRTIQTMVFEPATLTLHLSIGAGPTSGRPLTTLDLAPLLRLP